MNPLMLKAAEWEGRGEANRSEAIRALTEGDTDSATWHTAEYMRCNRIAAELRTEAQRQADRPDLGLQASEYLQKMLLAEALGVATWNPDKQEWTE